MIGRDRDVDMSTGAPGRPGYDAIGRYGAGNLYGGDVALPWVKTPQISKVSNRLSELNTRNMPVRIVVAQLPGQTRPRNLKNLVSRPLVLRPGNQSLGGR